MRNIAFVPLRGGSKSIPLKNIKIFCGKPLVFWVLKELSASKKIDQIIVATDSKEILRTIKSFNFTNLAIYERLPQNANDNSSTESVMLEYINQSDIEPNTNFILVQATSPFTKSYDFDNAIEMLEKEGFDSIISCSTFKRFIWNENGTPINYDHINRPRRQDFEGSLIENGAFYINKVRNILESKNRLSGNIGIYKMPEFTSLEIDEPVDWIIAEKLMKKYYLND